MYNWQKKLFVVQRSAGLNQKTGFGTNQCDCPKPVYII